jgi:5-methylcytosine-specific restriction endonuclease McrA
MSDAALFGESEDPAHLDGYGPIPAELAREIVAGACTRGEQVWLRRLYTSPTTGELLTMDTRARRFRHSLARFIRLRDQVCRTPWCNAPIRHGDHATDAATGGATSADNGQGLCEACNHAKQAPGWTAAPVTDTTGHAIETTMPTGHRYRTRPPPIARIHHLPPLRIDYLLTG